jgi:PIN domain nuclease of toxin-antitoxin system
MRVLLDTHVLIWWLKDDPKLGPRPRALIANGSVEVLFSAASCWEASIKHRSGRFELPGSTLFRMASEAGLIFVGIESDHLRTFQRLQNMAIHSITC